MRDVIFISVVRGDAETALLLLALSLDGARSRIGTRGQPD